MIVKNHQGMLFRGSFRRSASERPLCRSAARDAERPNRRDHAGRGHEPSKLQVELFGNPPNLTGFGKPVRSTNG